MKNVTINANSGVAAKKNQQSIFSRVANTATVRNMAALASALIGEEVTPEQMLCLMNTAAALFFLMFPVNISLVVRVLFLVWFIAGCLQCKAMGMGEDE